MQERLGQGRKAKTEGKAEAIAQKVDKGYDEGDVGQGTDISVGLRAMSVFAGLALLIFAFGAFFREMMYLVALILNCNRR